MCNLIVFLFLTLFCYWKGNFNLLGQHYQRNKPNHPPKVARLTAAAEQQETPSDQRSNVDHETDSGSDANTEDSDAPHSRATRHSKSQHMMAPRPITVQYYPGPWKTVLERAKNRFVQYVFVNHGFPVRDADLDVAQNILYEEIARGKREKLTLNNGTSFLCYQLPSQF